MTAFTAVAIKCRRCKREIRIPFPPPGQRWDAVKCPNCRERSGHSTLLFRWSTTTSLAP